MDPDMRFYRQQMAEAHSFYDSGQFQRAQAVLDRVIADVLFAKLDKHDQRILLSAAAWSHAQEGGAEGARALYLRANALGIPDPDDWYRLGLVEYDLKHYDDAARALTHVIEVWPELLPNMDRDFTHHLLHRTDPDSQARLDLMQALFDANWRGASGSENSFWYHLALRRVIRGESELARGPISRIEDPMSIVLLRSDKRFDALIDPEAWKFNVSAAAQRWVTRLREEADARPDSIDALIQLNSAMLTAGMHEEVITVVDTALARIASATPGSPVFQDMDDQVWLLNDRGIALRRLGRHDEAMAEMERAVQLSEDGGANVSQALNLAQFYCGREQPHKALGAIAELGEMSGYGKMVEATVRQCAALQLGDARAAARALKYMRSHRDDAEIAYLEGLLAAGEQDSAAGYLIELLASPDLLPQALEWMQDYATSHPVPLDLKRQASKATLLARTDVRQALEPVGRIAAYTIHGDYEIQ